MKIHLTGIGGVAMGNLAIMLKESGHKISGSDHKLYPPMSTLLKKHQIRVKPYSRSNIGEAELYIIGNAISRPHPEADEILNQGLEYLSLPAALARFFLTGKQVIVVAGTHGKTTTSFLMDHLLSVVDRPPGFFAGGVRADGQPGFRRSDSEYFVIEGDEYDSAFFDKGAKFLHYRPRHLILTSVEFDHADIYRNMAEYRRSFERLLRIVPTAGSVIACDRYREIVKMLEDYKLSPVTFYNDKTRLSQLIQELRPPTIPGLHNRLNATACFSLLTRLGFKEDELSRALSTFPGVMRRQQILFNRNPKNKKAPLTFIEDFAHHPGAVQETIAAMREAYPGRVLHALFEPRSATSHRNIFQKRYARSLARADHIYLCDVFNPKKVAPEKLLNIKTVLADIKKDKKRSAAGVICSGQNSDELLAQFIKRFKPSPQGDIILAMSNGAFGNIYPRLVKYLKSLS